MVKHTKQKLVEIFIDTIESEGAVVEPLSDKTLHPALIFVYGDINQNFRIYIWNLSRGGKGRPSDEYRIQITGIKNFVQEEGESTLILGYWAPLELFIAFDYAKHNADLGLSVSLQIREDALHEAVINGIAIHPKETGEFVAVFSRESALIYLRNHEQIHNGTYNLESNDKRNFIDLTEEEPSPHRYSVSSYGVDYPIESIVRRIDSDNIYVPHFQRQFIWGREEASRFIESIILGLPVPGVFLAHESTDRLIIVDGQQRLMSLYYFFKGILRGEKFTLKGVVPDLESKSYNTLSHEDKSRLDYQTIHATVLKPTDLNDDLNSIYSLFERLNTGGRRLTAQEIRSSIYSGSFNDYLGELVNSQAWVDIFGYSNDRSKSQELILRYFALFFRREKYEKPMSLFLNSFMANNRNFERYSKRDLDALILPTLSVISNGLQRRAFRIGGGINAAVFDSVMIALTSRLSKEPREFDSSQVKAAYTNLLKDDKYINTVRAGTSDKASIETRVQLAEMYFSREYISNPLL
ncbi:GmrSD restriction endonuclease domain-containing protein [Fibrella aquatica]|uniref:GmrSD restriction endonuclease domain-containing protein n=1 Tax=Fibrella aquatica TaxID=3242487 RepID=UPI0035215551